MTATRRLNNSGAGSHARQAEDATQNLDGVYSYGTADFSTQGDYAYGTESVQEIESVLPTNLRKKHKEHRGIKFFVKLFFFILLMCICLGIGAAIGVFTLFDVNPMDMLY
jgi:hypothetical protein